MTVKTQEIVINSQTFILHPTGAAYWKEKDMLLIADVHLGKITHFRKNGSAVPESALYKNFERLDEVLHYFQPETLCFLGDLFHSYLNKEWLLFSEWVRKTTSKIILIAGNHDIISPLRYEELKIQVSSEWLINSILLTHHPEERQGFFNISGHIHPGIRLHGSGKQLLCISCFFKRKHQLILPAFGIFTGKHVLNPEKEDQVFAITTEEVIQVNLH